MNKITLLLLIAFTSLTIDAQISYDKRIEFELKDGYSNEKIIEFGKHGFIMSSRNEETTGKENEWKYEKYDSNLDLIGATSIFLNKKQYASQTFTNKERTHTLYKDKKGSFSLITLEASNLEVLEVKGFLPKKSWISDMLILGDYAFIKAATKRAPFLFAINWKNGQKKLIPIALENISSKKTSIMNFQVLEEANEIFVYVKAQIDKKRTELYVIRLNDDGESEEQFNLTAGIEENIINISASKVDDNSYIYTGTYSTISKGLSEGLFICKAQKDQLDFIKFYKYLELENFLSYLPKKSQEKIEKKKAKKKKRGKELKFNYSIAAHEIIPIDGGYLFLGEAYYPTYRTESYTTTSTVNGVTSTTTHTRTVFDGYQYTHAILSKFDTEGNLLWDQIFEMRSTYKPFFVKRFISVAEKNKSSLKLVYASYNKITAKSFDFDGEVLQDFQSEAIQPKFEGDVSKSSFSNIDFWFDNYFIAYGQQKIKNKSGNKKVKRKRKIYFISKIKFQ